jgi:5'-methylthioadenosine phosphorylase
MSEATARIGVIGGSGLYAMDELVEVEEVRVSTPFGDPSDAITIGTVGGERVAFLPRHGRGHRILPADIPVRANIYALKSLGVQWVIAASAVGSLREDIAPTHMVIPDQIIDRTKNRISTFFTTGLVGHVSFAEPFCPLLSHLLAQAAEQAGATVHRGGTYICMEGPAFSTRAESNLYRSWGASVIGMTALPEAKLAREAELHYAMIAQSTDYDCWRPTEEVVTAALVAQTVAANIETVRRTLRTLIPAIPYVGDSLCANALASAVQTAPEAVSADAVADLGRIYARYAGS